MSVDQAAVGDQGLAMVTGYNAAAERIEAEIGQPIGRVLDIGCNTGMGMLTLAARWSQAQLSGIEPVARFVDKAHARGLHVQTASAELMPILSGDIELVFMRHSLEHVTNRAEALLEIRRVLVPGGFAYFQVPIEPGGTANPLHVSPFASAEEVRAIGRGWLEVYWGPQETVAELIVRKAW